MSENIYYVYMYLRARDSAVAPAGTPYYVGKGKNARVYAKHNVAVPKDQERIQFIAENITEQEAFDIEKQLIAEYGRVDRGTGILRNITDGGEGTSGWIPSKETRVSISQTLIALGDNHQSRRPEQRERVREFWKGPANPNNLPGMKERQRKRMLDLGDKNPAKSEEFSKNHSAFQFALGENHNWRTEQYREQQRQKMLIDNVAKRDDVRDKLRRHASSMGDAHPSRIMLSCLCCHTETNLAAFGRYHKHLS